MSEERFLRIKEVVEKTTLSRATIYRKVTADQFPKPKRLSHRVSVWALSAIDKWMEEALAG